MLWQVHQRRLLGVLDKSGSSSLKAVKKRALQYIPTHPQSPRVSVLPATAWPSRSRSEERIRRIFSDTSARTHAVLRTPPVPQWHSRRAVDRGLVSRSQLPETLSHQALGDRDMNIRKQYSPSREHPTVKAALIALFAIAP